MPPVCAPSATSAGSHRSSGAIRGAADRPAKSERRSRPFASRSNTTPIQPHVLRPVSIGFLGGFEVMQHTQRIVVSARRQQSAGTLDQVARPDKVVTTEVFVALVEAPRNREAGDDASQEVFGFVRAQNHHAGPVQIFFPRLLVELLQCPLPVLPVKDVVFAGLFVRREQGREGLLTGFRPDSAKAEGEDELAVTGGQVDFGGQRDVPVFRTLIFPCHLEMLREILPAVRYADKSDGTF